MNFTVLLTGLLASVCLSKSSSDDKELTQTTAPGPCDLVSNNAALAIKDVLTVMQPIGAWYENRTDADKQFLQDDYDEVIRHKSPHFDRKDLHWGGEISYAYKGAIDSHYWTKQYNTGFLDGMSSAALGPTDLDKARLYCDSNEFIELTESGVDWIIHRAQKQMEEHLFAVGMAREVAGWSLNADIYVSDFDLWIAEECQYQDTNEPKDAAWGFLKLVSLTAGQNRRMDQVARLELQYGMNHNVTLHEVKKLRSQIGELPVISFEGRLSIRNGQTEIAVAILELSVLNRLPYSSEKAQAAALLACSMVDFQEKMTVTNHTLLLDVSADTQN